MSLLELLLAENVADFNASRGERAKVDLFGADLAGRSLIAVDLSGADVDKADLTGADLSEATLYKARMSGIDGTGMKLVGALGAKLRMKEAYLDEADLTGADLSQADLTETVLARSAGAGLKLAGARLKEVDAEGAQWPDVDLSQSHLSRAKFAGADLSRADLTEAAGAEVGFAGAKLDGARGARARLPAADLTGASLVGARLLAANLTDANLAGADLSNADLTGANLTNAKLVGANLQGCVLAEAGLEGVDFTDVDLTGADLTGTDPVLLGLTEAQRASLKASGVPVNPGARLRPSKVSVARNQHLIVAVWENDDSAETAEGEAVEGERPTTIRYAVRTRAGVTHGILPVTAASLLSRGAVAVGEGVDLVLLRERPAGVVVERFHVDAEGRLGPGVVVPLGYQPVVAPVIRPEGEGMRMWGLARRGPTLVISEDGPEGFKPGLSKTIPTALGFLGRHHPLLACKGGVVMPCTQVGPGTPLKRPEGFPGKLATAVPLDDRWLAAWVLPPEGRHPGGIRAAWLGTRAAPEVEPVTDVGAVLSLDCIASGETAWLAWAELHGMGETRVFVRPVSEGFELPGVQIPVVDVDEVVFAPGPGAGLVLALTTDEERTVFVDEDGDVLGIVQA